MPRQTAVRQPEKQRPMTEITVPNSAFRHVARSASIERSAVLPTAPTREGGNHRKPTPTPWRSAVVRSPQQLVQYQVVTARVLAQCREFAVLEHVIQIGEFIPSRARPVELIAELLQRHPLHRLLHDTTVIASPRIHLPSVAEPNQIRLRMAYRTGRTPAPRHLNALICRDGRAFLPGQPSCGGATPRSMCSSTWATPSSPAVGARWSAAEIASG